MDREIVLGVIALNSVGLDFRIEAMPEILLEGVLVFLGTFEACELRKLMELLHVAEHCSPDLAFSSK